MIIIIYDFFFHPVKRFCEEKGRENRNHNAFSLGCVTSWDNRIDIKLEGFTLVMHDAIFKKYPIQVLEA